MSRHLVNIFTNNEPVSLDAMEYIRHELIERGYTVTSEYSPDACLIICIGGDGAFLETVHNCDFPSTPILGINTGHLGFFQEIEVNQIASFMEDFMSGDYTIQKLTTVKCQVEGSDGSIYHHEGLNEIAIKGRQSYAVHLDISIDGILIQKFSGDGVLCATAAGSTAYNYSLGGSIVDPRINLLQLTPIAPMITIAYRSFTSSLLLPSDKTITFVPEERDERIFIINDGIETGYRNVRSIQVTVSDKTIRLIRFKDYDFWSKVKSKFLL